MTDDDETPRCDTCGEIEGEGSCTCMGICDVCLLLWHRADHRPCRFTMCRVVVPNDQADAEAAP